MSEQRREFDHVILTRFSVRFEGSAPHDDAWLAYRWAFFCDALAASAQRQTVREFEWLVFFDIDTPAWLREQIDSVGAGLFTPRYVSTWSSAVVQESVAELAGAPYLITTRIDSDDAIATRFVEDIQAQFDAQASLYVNLLCGVQIERTGELYRYDEPSGAFISYIEKRIEGELPRTVFFNSGHGYSRLFADILNVVGPPRWMQIIHGSNVANGVRGLRVRPEPYQADFQFDLPFDRTVTDSRYRRERLRSLVDLARFWALYPYYAREFVYAQRLRRAGTQLLPKTDRLRTSLDYPDWFLAAARPARNLLRSIDRFFRRRRNRQRRPAE
ncbi:hypothetical protein HQQ81_19180 [Microbacteriaceae bacterium VKM Ac-2854]|nr:hypothetical protein [Microbacteriaceae bacterium VKM Ac-2854]